MSIHIGSMLFAGKRYAAEVYPDEEVWGYADLAEVAFGIIGKVCHMIVTCIIQPLGLAGTHTSAIRSDIV